MNINVKREEVVPYDHGCNWGCDDHIADIARKLPVLPSELIYEIGWYLEVTDLRNMRFVNYRFAGALWYNLIQTALEGLVIYPRYDKFGQFISLMNQFPVLPLHVSEITLVSEGVKAFEFGYHWAWEVFQDQEDIDFTENDIKIIETVNEAHEKEVTFNDSFINSGTYRVMLTYLLSHLPKLKKINVRKLCVGEDVPGWEGTQALMGCSFYHQGLNTNKLYYGEWQYDTVLKCPTTDMVDEYGEFIPDPNGGSQASFMNDLMAALVESGTKAKIYWA